MTKEKVKHSTLLSPAKVNLCLRVIGKRPDGYHEIYSLIQPITLSDEIVLDVGEGSGVSVICDNPHVPSNGKNLAHRAATLFLGEMGVSCRVTIRIKKRIPVSAGLGGGSSNAATVLMGLDGLLDTACGEERLRAMGARLGSDVPFFILKSPAIAQGRGDLLDRAEIPPYWSLLVNPGFEVSAAWAYANLNLTKRGPDIKLHNSKCVGKTRGRVGDLLFNDLEDAVLRAYPELNEMKDLLHGTGAEGVLMSGSGPTLFGLFFEENEAKHALERLRGTFRGGTTLFVAQGVG
ncbi:MAG: 4-(cytidine 5'-diphospho)-2-C-methyl-D-erythritol kinase [Thermodesulfobacteriota bacterium]